MNIYIYIYLNLKPQMFDTTSSFMRNAIFRYLFLIYSTQKVKKKKKIT